MPNWNQVEDKDSDKMKENLARLARGEFPGQDPSAAGQPLSIDGQPAPAAQPPAIDPQTAQFQAETGDDHIAQMQAQNLARAQQDPAVAAKLAAVQEQIKRQQAAQAAKLQGLSSFQQPNRATIGQSYPSEE